MFLGDFIFLFVDMVDNQEHKDNQNYEQKIVRMPDGQLAKVIKDYLYETDFYNLLIVVLKDQNSRNLVQIGKNTGVRAETKKSLVTLLDQNKEISKILDERLLKITKQPIGIDDTNTNYK